MRGAVALLLATIQFLTGLTFTHAHAHEGTGGGFHVHFLPLAAAHGHHHDDHDDCDHSDEDDEDAPGDHDEDALYGAVGLFIASHSPENFDLTAVALVCPLGVALPSAQVGELDYASRERSPPRDADPPAGCPLFLSQLHLLI